MERPLPVALIELRPDLREDLDAIADLAWMAVVWALREWSYGIGLHELREGHLGKDVDRLCRHLDHLGFFVHSAGEDISDWSTESLLAEFERSLSTIVANLKGEEAKALSVFEDAARRVRDFGRGRGSTPAPLSALLDAADRCFDVLLYLEIARRDRGRIFAEADAWFRSLDSVPHSKRSEVRTLVRGALGQVLAASTS